MLLIRVKAVTLSFDTASLAWLGDNRSIQTVPRLDECCNSSIDDAPDVLIDSKSTSSIYGNLQIHSRHRCAGDRKRTKGIEENVFGLIRSDLDAWTF
jgi:hypothetical protein